MNLLRITNNLGVTKKKAVWIDGGIHAREWVSPSAVTYMMHELLHNSHLYKDILDEFDLYILPLANPDG
jgi:murein tripeptide amidase MpaA